MKHCIVIDNCCCDHIMLTLVTNDKVRGISILKAFVDDKLSIAQTRRVIFRKLENIVGEGKNVGNLFIQCLQNLFLVGVL